MNSKLRKISSGEIFTVIETWWESENYTLVAGKDSVQLKIDEDTIKKEYEPVIPDYTGLVEKLPILIETSKTARKFLNTLAKRFTDGGYFHVGDLVYKEYPLQYYLGGPKLVDHTSLGDVGPKYAYKVTKVHQDAKYPFLWWVYIEPYDRPKRMNSESEEKYPMYMDRIEDDDVFSLLTKYDSEN